MKSPLLINGKGKKGCIMDGREQALDNALKR